MNDTSQILKNFFQEFPYRVFHETDSHNYENFFIIIDKDDLTNLVLKAYFSSYHSRFPLINLSQATHKYISGIENKYYFILIDKVLNTDIFYKDKSKFIINNAANILCVKMTGQPADYSEHFMNNFNRYSSQFKDISLAVGSLLKDKIKNKLKKNQD